MAQAPSFAGLHSASESSSRAKRASSAHSGTKPEILLQKALSERKLRFRTNAKNLPGKPDIVFIQARVAIFCDGDFWHGRNWRSLRKKLLLGTNSDYWIAKIASNMRRDKTNSASLVKLNWIVIRFWEGDIRKDASRIAQEVERQVILRREVINKRSEAKTKNAKR
jgi:DNA mismatch endonuclease (patch repair protein)